jgi:hypothetical protein
MYTGDIVIHDLLGWTQADRRAALLEILEVQRATRAKCGLAALTWTEQPDGLTCYHGGVWESRILWSEIIADEDAAGGGREPDSGLE